MHKKFIKVLISGIVALAILVPSTSIRASRTTTLLDDGWRFTLTPDSVLGLPRISKTVNLPHDWSIDYDFYRNAPAGNDGGYLPTGRGEYTKTISVKKSQLEGRKHFLEFDGVYERSEVFVNDSLVGFRPYGYSSFIYDVTPYLKLGDNTIKVIADNSAQKNCRWYSGSGIYRHVKHIETADSYIVPRSLYINATPLNNEGKVNVSLSVNDDNNNGDIEMVITVSDRNAKNILQTAGVPVNGQFEKSLIIENAELWSPDSPALYTLTAAIKRDGKIIDEVSENFGIRSVDYSADEGLKLNGKPIVLNGGCVHHDNGILGAASFDAAEARKVRLLKESGFNAVRTSHNPPSQAFLDECDRQGLLVIDEAFDGWRDAKTPNDYSKYFDDWAIKDVGDMVLRDRNHPSIIMWSIGNEVIERKRIEIVTTARKLAAECHRLDPSRPVTSALCAWDSDWEIYDPLAEALDIVGYNYMIHKSESDHERCPQRIMMQTESYPADAFANYKKVKYNPYIIGDFVWTAIDYLGESGIGRYHYTGETPGEHYQRDQWPWHGAYCGDVDLICHRKPISYYREMLYNESPALYMSVLEPQNYKGEIQVTQWGVYPSFESWNWEGHEGKPITVEIISRYPEVELFLNDKSVGRKAVGEENEFKAPFTIEYTPGILKAVAYDNDGVKADEFVIKTAGKPYAIRLNADKNQLEADNQDLIYITAEVIDAEGNVVPNATNEIKFTLAGAGDIIATGSADLKSEKSYATNIAKAWQGRVLTVVRASDKKGSAVVSATSPGLKEANVHFKYK